MKSNLGVKRVCGRSVIGVREVATRAVVHRVLAATFAVMCLHSAVAFGQCTLTGTLSTWNVAGNSDWDTASNWKPAGVPNSSSTSVCITNGKSSVTMDISPSVLNLQLASGNTLSFNDNTQLSVSGTQIINAGQIVINGGNGTNTYLTLGSSATLSGAGTMALSTTTTSGGNAYIQGNSTTLTNSSTIEGDGIIGNGSLALVNTGTLNANSTGATGVATYLYLDGSGNVTNTGLLEATNSGALQIANTVNNSGGNVTANGATASVQLYNGADIQAGTLNTLNGGTVEAVSNNTNVTLDGSTHGALTVSKGSTYTSALNTQTVILGAINNNGNIQLNGGSGTNTELSLQTNTTLQGAGGGTVTLNTVSAPNGGNAYIQGNGLTLTNTNNIIQGAGIIGNGSLALVNKATLNANSTGANAAATYLDLNGSGNVTNTGLMEATNSGALQIQNTVNNSGGNVTANGSAASVQLYNGGDIQGGTLNTLNGGTFETVPNNTNVTLDGTTNGPLTVSKGSTYTSALSTQTVILGTINNNGSIALIGGGGTNTELTLATNATLQGAGGGTVTLTTLSTNGGSAYIQGNSFTLTNTNNTIQGAGIIGNGSLVLNNQAGGVINANSTGNNQTGGTSTYLALNGSGGVTNAGLLEATNNGVLQIQNTVNNAGGTITANGSGAAVNLLNGSHIQAGTLSTLNSGTMITPYGNSTTLDGRSVAQGGEGTLTLNGSFKSDFNTTTTMLGTLNNLGTILVNAGFGTNTALSLGTAGAPNLVLQGGGTLTLNTYSSPSGGSVYIEAAGTSYGLTNVNNTIQGEGVIGNGSLILTNEAGGVINANSTGSNQPGGLSTALTLNGSGGVTNAGLLEATNNGALQITNTVNNSGGNITANGSGASVQLYNGGDIQGGTLNQLNGATLGTAVSNTATLDGSTNGALTLSKGSTYTTPLNSQTQVLGTINNNGTIRLTGGSGTNTELTLISNTTLQGGGTVTLNTVSSIFGGSVYIQGNSLTLTNTNNTIQGAGIIGNGSLTLVNGGTIFANSPSQTLLINGSGDITNDGTLEVASGSVLHVTNGPFTKFSGTTLTGGTYNVSGTLEIDQLGNTGGEIVTNDANIILNGTASSFVDDAGLNALTKLATNAGSFDITGGQNFTTAGNFTNNGTLTVGSGSLFDVHGNLTNISGTTISGGTYDLAGTLKANNAVGLTTNSANIILTGTGELESENGVNALTDLATNSSGASFTINGGANFTTAGNFTNNGTLTVGSSTSKFDVKNTLTNLSGTTLSGGTYNVTGTLQYGNTSAIATNSASITLTGSSAQILDSSSANALGGLASNTSTGKFTVTGGQTLTDSATAFSNAGSLTVGASSALTLSSATGTYTQTAGTTTVDGTLTSKGGMTFSGGSVFGNAGTFNAGTNALTNSATFNIGNTTNAAGSEAVTGGYTQGSTGVLDISIGGTTAGTQFDQLNISSAAKLNGTLNLDLINGFVPTVGETFDILNASSVTGKFPTVTGTAINSTEEFTVAYNATNVTLDVVSDPKTSTAFSSANCDPKATPEPSTLLLLGSGLLLTAHYARRRAGRKGGRRGN
jgi:hypothetical protein